MSQRIQRLLIPLVFPNGISPGEQAVGNHLFIARDGKKRPVLRGTALAGALRHEWVQLTNELLDASEDWFGCALHENKEEGATSPLRIPDCLLQIGEDNSAQVRTHIAMDRHRGSVIKGGLFSLETLPPGTRTSVCLYLYVPEGKSEEAKQFLSELVLLFERGMTLGGNAARGVGDAKLAGNVLWQEFNAKNPEQQGALLDEQYKWRNGELPTTGAPLTAAMIDTADFLRVDLVLGIPPGEDLLVGDGQGMDYEMEPQRVRCADGAEHWRLPGSTLRGAIRGWMTRLAARDGKTVADSVERHQERQDEGVTLKGQKIAWGFMETDQRKQIQNNLAADPDSLAKEVPCPIMRLFGSGFSKGRIHVSDAVTNEPLSQASEQLRAHVGIDRITAGANEGFFFQNTVLKGDVKFPLSITIKNPEEHEVQWLYSALRAIDLGIVRIGSSKASGRLAVVRTPVVKGKYSEKMSGFKMSEVK